MEIFSGKIWPTYTFSTAIRVQQQKLHVMLFTLSSDCRQPATVSMHQLLHAFCTMNTTCLSQNVLGIPAVLVLIIHVIQHFHMFLVEFPVQQLVRACLTNVDLVKRFWNHSAALLQSPPQQNLH